MAELKNIRIAVSGVYEYALEEIPTLRIPMPGHGAPDWVEEKRLYKVYRPAAVLAVACPKFSNLPMTHHHPKAPVDGQNFRDLAIGWTGEHPEVDYIAETNEVGIRSTCMLYDDEALNAYQNGEIQLSPGYIADFEWQKGTTPDGQEYDIIMKRITDVNHLALLPAGRGGDFAVVLDEAPKYESVFDLVRKNKDCVIDVRYEDGHVSHRSDGDYIKENNGWRKLEKSEKRDRNVQRQEIEAGKIEKALIAKGYEVKIDKSRNYWGNSTYITPMKNGEPLFYKGKMVKFRLSDHPYTSESRSEINIANAEQVINSLNNIEKNSTVGKTVSLDEVQAERAAERMRYLKSLEERKVSIPESFRKEVEENYYKYFSKDQAPQRKTIFDIAKSNNLFDMARRRLWAQK